MCEHPAGEKETDNQSYVLIVAQIGEEVMAKGKFRVKDLGALERYGFERQEWPSRTVWVKVLAACGGQDESVLRLIVNPYYTDDGKCDDESLMVLSLDLDTSDGEEGLCESADVDLGIIFDMLRDGVIERERAKEAKAA